jgi:hypothetical protein
MANPSPTQARLAKKSARKPGDLRAIQRKLWGAVLHAEEVMERAVEDEVRLRAIHALSQACGQYAKLLEVGELEARLAALEGQVPPQPRRKR